MFAHGGGRGVELYAVSLAREIGHGDPPANLLARSDVIDDVPVGSLVVAAADGRVDEADADAQVVGGSLRRLRGCGCDRCECDE